MIFQSVTKSFMVDLIAGVHDFQSDSLKIALYGSTASLGEDTTAYSAVGESSGDGYTAGGVAITASVMPQLQDGSIVIDFADVTFPAVTLTARGALIYNTSRADKSIAVIDFGLDIMRTGSDLTIRFPEPDKYSGMIRIIHG